MSRKKKQPQKGSRASPSRRRLAAIRTRLSATLLVDEPKLRGRLKRAARTPLPDLEKILARLEADIVTSEGRVVARRNDRPRLGYPAELPVATQATEIGNAIENHQVIVVCGETGSGKTTQLPKICLDIGRGSRGMIGHTQPRRIAARAVAARISAEINRPLGQLAGYKIRFSDRTGPDCRIKLMTDGILLAELQHDRWLRQYDTLIIDEAHERSLNIDFLLGCLTKILPRRPDLRVVVTSATIDPDRFSRYFGHAPVIEVSGRTWPVEALYRPLSNEEDATGARSQLEGVLAAIDELSAAGDSGDILVFLAGERDIRETADALRRHHPEHAEILPLFARLSAAEQDRVFRPGDRRRIVLATNIAETSLTVPGIRYVVDPGRARISRYSYRSKIQRLLVEPISQASANQRMGRCGRQREGVCIRLYDEQEFLARPLYTDPEILRTNLANVILDMEMLSLGRVEDFPFMDPPDTKYVRDGYRLLRELGAVDGDGRITTLGRRMGRFPLDPRLSRMILAAEGLGCIAEILVIVSMLSIRDPRERPLEKQAEADAEHKAWAEPRSDFMSVINLWEAYLHKRKHLSVAKQRRWCRDHFLSFVRMREWYDVQHQLEGQVREQGMRVNTDSADYGRIHRALLSGLLSHIGYRHDERVFAAARQSRFTVSPGSVLRDKPPRWIVAASLVETSKVFAHMAGRVEPAWIEEAAAHLVRRSHEDPHWSARRGHVVARETVTLFGLVLAAGRRVDFGRIDPVAARRIFIEEALVTGRHHMDARFVRHNRRLMDDVLAIEARLRRKDLSADRGQLAAFYEARVPPEICDLRSFESWRRCEDKETPELLFMTDGDVRAKDTPGLKPGDYPDYMEVEGNRFPLSYRFEPGSVDDGVTVSIPRPLLAMVEAADLEWLVPGMLLERVIAMIRALPKTLRRRLVPAPDVARRCLAELEPGSGGLEVALAASLSRAAGVQVDPGSWRASGLPDHLRMNIRVIGLDKRSIGQGRDLRSLQDELAESGPINTGRTASAEGRSGMTAWDVGELPRTVRVTDGDGARHVFPAIRDDGDSVSLRYYAARLEAESVHRQGTLRLFLLALPRERRYLAKEFRKSRVLSLSGAGLGGSGDLVGDLVEKAFETVFMPDDASPIRNGESFQQRLEERRLSLVADGTGLAGLTEQVLTEWRQIAARLESGLKGPGAEEAATDIEEQLSHLVYPGWLQDTPSRWLREFPRYLAGILCRIEKLEQGQARDAALLAQVRPFWLRWLEAAGEGGPDPSLASFRWLIEEFRVSLFAQTLGTALKVSAKRLDEEWQRAGRFRGSG